MLLFCVSFVDLKLARVVLQTKFESVRNIERIIEKKNKACKSEPAIYRPPWPFRQKKAFSLVALTKQFAFLYYSLRSMSKEVFV